MITTAITATTVIIIVVTLAGQTRDGLCHRPPRLVLACPHMPTISMSLCSLRSLFLLTGLGSRWRNSRSPAASGTLPKAGGKASSSPVLLPPLVFLQPTNRLARACPCQREWGNSQPICWGLSEPACPALGAREGSTHSEDALAVTRELRDLSKRPNTSGLGGPAGRCGHPDREGHGP